jgi:hypothetical protein
MNDAARGGDINGAVIGRFEFGRATLVLFTQLNTQ